MIMVSYLVDTKIGMMISIKNPIGNKSSGNEKIKNIMMILVQFSEFSGLPSLDKLPTIDMTVHKNP
jgi:hypothetical protein